MRRSDRVAGVPGGSSASEGVPALVTSPTRPAEGRILRIEVPATSANLGPGFDTLGLALGLSNTVEVSVLADLPPKLTLVVAGEGAESLSDPANNLLVQAVRWGWQYWAAPRPLPSLHLACYNRIPLASGLGSSAAAIVSGLAIAWWLAAAQQRGGGGRVGRSTPGSVEALPHRAQQELLDLAAQLEGHPDNVAAAIWGGLTVALPVAAETEPSEPETAGTPEPERPRERERPKIWVERLPVAPWLWAAVVTPNFPLSTARSREVLPERVARQDALFNLSRTAWLVAAVARQDWARLGAGLHDRLHQPYRAALIPGLAAVLAAGRQAGALGATLSGAGPSVLALARGQAAAEAAGRAMQQVWAQWQVESEARIVPVGVSGVKWDGPEMGGPASVLGEAEGCQS